MNWSDVGSWLKNNAGTSAALVGSLLTGNAPGAIAAGVALVSSATGTTDAAKALAALQSDPATMIRLKELSVQDDASIRDHIRSMTEMQLKDAQLEQEQQQLTIRTGDTAEDPYVRQTRPMMARQSWYATVFYIISFEGCKALKFFDIGANWDLAMILLAPAAAYLGFRSLDKFRKK